MPDDCDRLNCCPEESLGYEVPKENPNPPGIPTYTLTVDDDIDGGRVEPGTSEYSQNTFATIKAIPEQGYKFKRWDGDVEGSENPASVYMDRNKSVSAVFEPIIHLVTAKTNPVGAGTVNGSGLKAWGSTVEIETVPNAGYAFSHYSGDLNTTNNPADLYVDGDKEIVANLDQITYNLNILTNPEGAGLPLGAGDYTEGATANISANPLPGYCFYSWSGDVSSMDDPEQVLMDSNKTVTANYQPFACCQPYVLVLVLDQTASIGLGGAAAGINIINTTNIHAIGVVSFGDSICDIYPITTDLDAVKAYLEAAIETPPEYECHFVDEEKEEIECVIVNGATSFWCDGGGDGPENGIDALNVALEMLSSYSTDKPKAIYFKTDTPDYAHNTSSPEAVNSLLNSPWMTISFLEFGDYFTTGNRYADAFPQTDKVTWEGFPDCTPPQSNS
jgi:hypothetical protein